MIKLNNISQVYDNKTVLNNINLEFPDSGFVIIYGADGAGKTTLINIIGAAITPASGTLEVNGKAIAFADPLAVKTYREQDVSFIYTNPNLFENMTVEENIKIVGDNPKFDEIVTKLGLKESLTKKVKDLSSQEKSLVGIARGLAKDCKILLVDEPIATIEAKLKPTIYEALTEAAKTRLVIATTQDKLTTENYGDTIINIKSGSLNEIYSKFETTPTELKAGTHQNSFNLFKFTFKNFFTNKGILIPTIVLLIIGMISTFLATSLLGVNYDNLYATTMNLEHETSIFITKKDGTLFEEEEISTLSTKLQTPISVGKKINIENQYIKLVLNPSPPATSQYYSHTIADMVFYPIDDCPALIAGDLPTNPNEMVINSYLADLIIKQGVRDMEGTFYKPTSYEDLVSSKHELFLASLPVVVTGISKLNDEKYEPLKEKDSEFLKNLADKYFSLNADHIYVQDSFFSLFENYHPTLDAKYMTVTSPGTIDVEGKYTPGNQLNFTIFKDPVQLKRSEELIDYIAPDEIIINGSALNATGLRLEEVIDHELTVYYENKKDHSISEPYKYRVVGISEDGNNYINIEGMKDFLVKPFNIERIELNIANEQKMQQLIEDYKEDETYNLETTFAESYITLEKVGTIALYVTAGVGGLLLIISIFFIKSYVGNSVKDHTRDIGVLKMFGIETKKINLMFILENVVIILGSYLVSLILFFIIRPIVALIIKGIYTLELNILPLAPLYFLLVFLVIAVFIGLATLLATKDVKKTDTSILFKIRRNNTRPIIR